MAQDDKKYYFISEFDEGMEVTGEGKTESGVTYDKTDYKVRRSYLTSNPRPLFDKYGTFFRNLEAEEWIEQLIDNEFGQRMAGFAVRKATTEDLEDFANELAVIDAIEAFKNADIEANRTKRRARYITAEWFSENVATPEDAKDFFATHRLNPFQFAAWVDTYEEPNKDRNTRQREMSTSSIKALVSHWTGKNAKLKGKAKDKAENIAAFRELSERAKAA
jgi:hypothetical protein